MRVLTLNPGGTSTKIAAFEDDTVFFKKSIVHDPKETARYTTVFDQLPFRMKHIKDALEEAQVDLKSFDAVVGRGGLMKPIEGGTYHVSKEMIADMEKALYGEHASNLGAPLAYELASSINVPSFVVDPVSVDEFLDMIRITGLSDIVKHAWMHPLNHKAVCRLIAPKYDKTYEEGHFIVAHLGSGISIAAHEKGRMVDGSGGRCDGPFSPERCGGIISYPLVELCYSGKYTEAEMVDKISNAAGFYDYLGTKDMQEVEKMVIDGDEKATLVWNAFIYQCAKEITSYAAILKGKIDCIILTGGIAHSEKAMQEIAAYVDFLAPVEVVSGELEMEAMAQGAMRVLTNVEKAKTY